MKREEGKGFKLEDKETLEVLLKYNPSKEDVESSQLVTRHY